MSDRLLKNRENRLRRLAQEKGYMLVKSRRRNPWAEDHGLYYLAGDCAGNRCGRRGGQEAVSAFANGWGVTLDKIEWQLA